MRLSIALSIAVLASCGVRHPPRPGAPIRPLGPDDELPRVAPVKALAATGEVKAAIREPEPAPDTAPTRARLTLSELIGEANAKLRDIFFGYDSFALDRRAAADLEFNHSVLRPLIADFPKLEVTLEGHCDERGSAEYNIGLGDLRAKRVLDFLRHLGTSETLRPVSYGREKPQCLEASEACWSRNRRVHLVVQATP